MDKELGGIVIALVVLVFCSLLAFMELPSSVFGLVVDRLLCVIGVMFMMLYLGLWYRAMWAVMLFPLLSVGMWGAFVPLLTHWGTAWQLPYGETIAFYGSTTFHVGIGLFILVMEYAWLWRQYINKDRSLSA